MRKIDCITKVFQELEVLSRVQNKLIAYQQERNLSAYNQQLNSEKEDYNWFTNTVIIAHHNLQSVMIFDAMTKVANRNKFDEYLNSQWQKLSSEKLPLSLLLCNLDFLNHHNNADTNLTADNYLRHISTEIKSVVKRSTDLVARYEDKKFAVILSNTDSKGAMYVAKLIQQKVDQLKIDNSQFLDNDCFTLTTGIATIFPSAKMTPNTLIDMVEKAIDQTKAQVAI